MLTSLIPTVDQAENTPTLLLKSRASSRSADPTVPNYGNKLGCVTGTLFLV